MLSHTHPFNGHKSETTRVSRYMKGKTNLDFTEARDSELQWHQLGHKQVCTSLGTDNHTSTTPLSFLQAGRPSCEGKPICSKTVNGQECVKSVVIDSVLRVELKVKIFVKKVCLKWKQKTTIGIYHTCYSAGGVAQW